MSQYSHSSAPHSCTGALVLSLFYSLKLLGRIHIYIPVYSNQETFSREEIDESNQNSQNKVLIVCFLRLRVVHI